MFQIFIVCGLLFMYYLLGLQIFNYFKGNCLFIVCKIYTEMLTFFRNSVVSHTTVNVVPVSI